MSKCIEKIKHLNEILLKRDHISIGDALEINDFDLFLENKKELDDETLSRVAAIFYLEENILKDDSKDLPHDDALAVDETIIAHHKNDYEKELGKKKEKNVIKRNFLALNLKKRKKLILNLALTCIPFIAFALYSIITVSINSAETIDSYRNENSLSATQKEIEDSLPAYGTNDSYFCDTYIGAQLENINNISTSNNSYTVSMSLRYDFDQMDFHKMWWKKQKGEVFNSDSFYTDADLSQDSYCFNSTGDGWLAYSDNIPDIIQFNFETSAGEKLHLSPSLEPTSISSLYTEERAAYPGEKSSNVYSSKNDEFSIGNGKVIADSLEYLDKGTAYKSESSFRFGQKLHFNANINKKFDSPRYPLESSQFRIYIQPTRTTDYIRYIPDESMSGFSTYFSISGGYSLVTEKGGIKNFIVMNNYYVDKDLDRSSITYGKEIIKSQLEIVVRANKHGLSVFINSFLNIIAVAAWLILAFFNQSFNKDDSIGMIGTGFFSAISAILLGFSIVSSADTFSLLSVVNIFTLGMVLTMGYESIAARRANKIQDASLIAYRTVKIRVLFYFFVAFSLLMYLILPAISYLWIL